MQRNIAGITVFAIIGITIGAVTSWFFTTDHLENSGLITVLMIFTGGSLGVFVAIALPGSAELQNSYWNRDLTPKFVKQALNSKWFEIFILIILGIILLSCLLIGINIGIAILAEIGINGVLGWILGTIVGIAIGILFFLLLCNSKGF